jgi:hypothetical protein
MSITIHPELIKLTRSALDASDHLLRRDSVRLRMGSHCAKPCLGPRHKLLFHFGPAVNRRRLELSDS